MFTHQPMKVFFISVVCAIASAVFCAAAPSALSAPSTVVVAFPQNNVDLGSPVDVGFNRPPIPTNSFGFWYNTSVSLRFPNGTVQLFIWTWSSDCDGTLIRTLSVPLINSSTPIEYNAYSYPTTDTGVYVGRNGVLVLQRAYQLYP